MIRQFVAEIKYEILRRRHFGPAQLYSAKSVQTGGSKLGNCSVWPAGEFKFELGTCTRAGAHTGPGTHTAVALRTWTCDEKVTAYRHSIWPPDDVLTYFMAFYIDV